VEVSALLRSSGRTERFSRTAKIRDVAAIKAARAEQARLERAQLEAAWDLLATDGPIRISHLGTLDHTVFERLMDLLGRALSARPDRHGNRRALTSDGRMEIVLHPPADDRTTILHTSRGTLTTGDYTIDIRTPGTQQATAPRKAAG
jgi:uncharacterized protein (TIGR02677 family)